MRKALSIVLCLMMLVTTLGAFAESTEEANDYSFLESAGGAYTENTIQVLLDAMDVDTSSGTVFGDGYFGTSAESATTTFPDTYPRDMIYNISDEEIEAKVEALLKTLTFSEKVHLLTISEQDDPLYGSTSQPGYNSGVPRLGIPTFRMFDGPAGVNTYYFETTSLPLELLAAATFDTDMAYNYGSVLGSELESIGGNWQLGTQFDLGRTASWNRIRDTFGEDYFLVGEMAIAETEGVQENGAMAMGKHVGAYSTNGDKNLNVEVDEQTLHTAYLYPFEMATKYGDLSSMMTTYNRLNGIYTSSNYEMQIDIFQDMWNFAGAMVPDWGGNNEYTQILGNTMSQTRDEENFVLQTLAVMEAGLMTMEDLDNLVACVLYCYGVGGYLNLVEVDERTGYAKEEVGRTEPIELENTYYADREDGGLYDENHAKVLEMAEKGIVLTKNENDALPLTEEDYTGENSVALIGRYGSYYKSGVDGERSWGILEYQTSPYESMTELLGEDANIVAEVMVEPYGDVIPAEYFFQDAEGTQSGLVRTYGILDEDFVESSGGDMSAMLATRLADLEAQLAEDPENESLISEIAQLEEMMAQTASSGEEEETDNTVTMEGYATGEVYGVDANIDFNTGSERSYWNGEDGTAFEYGEVYTWKGYLQAPESGEYTFSIAQMGGTATFSIVVDGEKQTASNSTASTRNAQSGDTTLEGLVASSVSVTLEAGQMYEVVITTDNTTGYSDYYDQAVQLMWILPSQPEADLQAAYDAAASASKVVYFTTAGTNTYDMAVTDAETIKELAAITHENGGQFIVVFLNRSAFATDEGDWLQDCDAVVVAWYSGQAYGEAITNILTGEVNPSGKLSLSFPKTSEETVITYDGMEIERGGDTSQQTYTAVYSEGLDFGYRFYDSEDLEVGWAFGYGLSYTTFELSDLQVQAVDAVDEYGRDVSYEITVTVTNTGDVAGSEVVQVYVDGAQDAPEHVQVTEKQLCAFARVDDLEPGESRSVTMPVTTRMLEYWDTEIELIEREDGTSDKWVLGTGERTFMVGNSSDNLTLSEVVVVE